MEVLVMITTESSNANALRMAKLLIQNKLAACVSIKQIFSIYMWDDDIEETKEFEITIKSKLEFKDRLIDFINKKVLVNKNILLAIGSRLLNDTASYYSNCGANVFTRVMPTYESITKAFGSCIKNSNIAILEPSKKKGNILEKKLCDHWKIDFVLCRDSGSYAQIIWEEIVRESNMKLFLVKRPKLKYKNPLKFFDYDKLINHITRKT